MIQSIFVVKGILEMMVAQNYFVFEPTRRYFETVSNTNDHVLSWKSKGFSEKNINPTSTSNNILNPLLNYAVTKKE